jgi:hypothetical protein
MCAVAWNLVSAQLMLWQTFAQQAGQAQASKTFEDVEVEGEQQIQNFSPFFSVFFKLYVTQKLL